MKLRLINGYPYPFPSHLPEDEQEAISTEAPGVQLTLEGVTHFEWMHTVTVEFDLWGHYCEAREKTGWKRWSDSVLEAPTSAGDGYGHPAIIVGNMAYCGFILENDDAP